jgi:hypothetical protein
MSAFFMRCIESEIQIKILCAFAPLREIFFFTPHRNRRVRFET